MLDLKSADVVITGVVFNGKWRWYVTEKEYWIMDMVKWEQDWLNNGYEVYQPGEYLDRFNIGILDQNTAEDFFSKIEGERIHTSELTEMIVNLDQGMGKAIIDYFPTFVVDFDHRHFYSLYREMFEFERYVPTGWVGEYRDFMELVPEAERYWMYEGENLLMKIWAV